MNYCFSNSLFPSIPQQISPSQANLYLYTLPGQQRITFPSVTNPQLSTLYMDNPTSRLLVPVNYNFIIVAQPQLCHNPPADLTKIPEPKSSPVYSPPSTNCSELAMEPSPNAPGTPEQNKLSFCSRKPAVPFDTNSFWTDENIKKLLELSHRLRQDWKKIAKKFNVKHITPTVVRNKYREMMKNDIPLWQKFTHEEDVLIAKYYSIYGFDWKKIAQHLKSRTHIMVKNRFYSHIKKYNLLKSLIDESNRIKEEPQD